MKCLTDHELEMIAAGAGAALVWQEHLATCEDCQGRLEEVEKDLELQEEIQEIKQEGFYED